MKKKIVIMGVILSILMVAGVVACYAATITITDGNSWQESYVDDYTYGRTYMRSCGSTTEAYTCAKNTNSSGVIYAQIYVAECVYTTGEILQTAKSTTYLTGSFSDTDPIDRDYDNLYRYYLHKCINYTDDVTLSYKVYQLRH